jgi:hypothetical protein
MILQVLHFAKWDDGNLVVGRLVDTCNKNVPSDSALLFSTNWIVWVSQLGFHAIQSIK